MVDKLEPLAVSAAEAAKLLGLREWVKRQAQEVSA